MWEEMEEKMKKRKGMMLNEVVKGKKCAKYRDTQWTPAYAFQGCDCEWLDKTQFSKNYILGTAYQKLCYNGHFLVIEGDFKFFFRMLGVFGSQRSCIELISFVCEVAIMFAKCLINVVEN